jgi:Sel1 repeat
MSSRINLESPISYQALNARLRRTNISSGCATKKELQCHRAIQRPSDGIGCLPCKAIQTHNTNFATCVRGQGLPQDYQKALRWCGLAADQGHGGAMFMLGRLCHTAHGVAQDFVRAHMWYNLATAHGYNNGKKWRDRVADDMSPRQIAEAQKLAREWSVRMRARQS